MTRPLGPPAWADALVSLVLNVEDRESVTGDLIEEYCETILPAVGKTRAVLWYLQQVAGYVWRAVWFWAMLHTIEFLARTAIDWFWPTHDFVAAVAPRLAFTCAHATTGHDGCERKPGLNDATI